MDANALRVASPPPRPLMVWDGDCHFCGGWVRRWQHVTGDEVDYEPYQSVGNRFPEIKASEYAREIHLIFPDGRVARGAAAVFAALNTVPGHSWSLWLYQSLPPFAKISEWFYRGVAQNRAFLSLLTRIFWGDPGVRSTYRFSGMLFLRMLGLIYLIAFISFWAQSAGLVGDHGLFPIKDYFSVVKAQAGSDNFERFMAAPSLLWLSPDSAGLNAICGTGVGCALLVMMGLVPGWALLGCVLMYGSLRGGVPIFLNFQWDILLVESGLVALLFAPWGLWQKPMAPREPPVIGRWAVWWLLFKLMVMSGLVKLLWNDTGPGPTNPDWFRHFVSYITSVPIGKNTWLDGTALQYHYFTQPIPAATSWWFAHLPDWFQSTSLWTCMTIELIVPFAFFGPRRLRHIAALLQIFLQVMFLISGNYGFFNLLTIVLCLPLFDDTFWPARVRSFIERGVAPVEHAPSRARYIWNRSCAITRATLAGFILIVGLVEFHETWQARTGAPAQKSPTLDEVLRLDFVTQRLQEIGIVNTYGLFRVMTTERPELVVEGSDDGQTWKEYDFVWKPGDPMREPSFSTPHMPRLDWQMWFAANEIYDSRGTSVPRWLVLFCGQLRAGNPNVIGLLDHNPFPNAPPKQLRIVLYLYNFTTREEHAKTGAWWTRTQAAVLSLK